MLWTILQPEHNKPKHMKESKFITNFRQIMKHTWNDRPARICEKAKKLKFKCGERKICYITNNFAFFVASFGMKGTTHLPKHSPLSTANRFRFRWIRSTLC